MHDDTQHVHIGELGILAAARGRAEAIQAHALRDDVQPLIAAVPASDPGAREPSDALRAQMDAYGGELRVVHRLVVVDGQTHGHWVSDEHMPPTEELVQFTVSETVIDAGRFISSTEIVLAAKSG